MDCRTAEAPCNAWLTHFDPLPTTLSRVPLSVFLPPGNPFEFCCDSHRPVVPNSEAHPSDRDSRQVPPARSRRTHEQGCLDRRSALGLRLEPLLLPGPIPQ